MNPFPELSELSRFFESKPVIGGGPDEPWFYNTLRFVAVRNSDRIECVIEPGEYIISLRWYREETEIMKLQLETVNALELTTQGQNELMRANFYHQSGEGYLLLQLKPYVHVSIGGIKRNKSNYSDDER